MPDVDIDSHFNQRNNFDTATAFNKTAMLSKNHFHGASSDIEENPPHFGSVDLLRTDQSGFMSKKSRAKPLNSVDTNKDVLISKVTVALQSLGFPFLEQDPQKITRHHLSQLMRKAFGLRISAVQCNESMIVARQAESKEIFKEELSCYDTHFNISAFCDWLHENIPLMHTVKEARFDLPKVSHRKHQMMTSQSSMLGSLNQYTLASPQRVTSGMVMAGDGKKPTLQMINEPSFATLPAKNDAKAA